MNLFLKVPGGIEVRGVDDGLTLVSTPNGFSDLAFRTAVAGAYTFFVDQGRLPTVDDLFRAWPDLPKKTYAGLFMTPEFREALEYRGIAWDETRGLSLEQQNVIMMLSDPTDKRTLSAKLKSMRVPMPRYSAWLRQPLFAEHLNKVTKSAYTDHLPMIRQALIGNAMNSDMKAIEMVFAMTGEWNPNAQSVQDAKQVVLSVIEAVIRNVPDLDMRKRILADVQGAVVGFDVTQPKQLGV